MSTKRYRVKRAHWHNRTATMLRIGDSLPRNEDEHRIKDLLRLDLIEEVLDEKDAGESPSNKDAGPAPSNKDAGAAPSDKAKAK